MTKFTIDFIRGFSLGFGFEYVDDADIQWYAAVDLAFIRFAFIGYKQA